MDWLLVFLAVFNLGSMWIANRDRHVARVDVPWLLYLYSLIATELSWLWLPIQVSLAAVFICFGALSSWLGINALLVLVISWIPLARNIVTAFDAVKITEMALRDSLGEHYTSVISESKRHNLEFKTRFREWRRPFAMNTGGVEKIKNISYGPGGIKHKMDIYRPTDLPREGCPVLLQIHGGAWTMGSKEHQGLPLMHYMASKGWICVAINYRLSPSVEFPVHLEDCKRAIAWIRREGGKYGMKSQFIAITGGSAGGHLAALTALTANNPALQKECPDADTSIQAAVPFYGVYDLLERHDATSDKLLSRFVENRIIFTSPDKNPALWDLASPVTHLAANSPPFMIVQGGIDSLTTVRGAHIFYDKLRDISKNSVTYLELPGAEHGFDSVHSPRTDAVIKGVHRFLEWQHSQYEKV